MIVTFDLNNDVFSTLTVKCYSYSNNDAPERTYYDAYGSITVEFIDNLHYNSNDLFNNLLEFLLKNDRKDILNILSKYNFILFKSNYRKIDHCYDKNYIADVNNIYEKYGFKDLSLINNKINSINLMKKACL